MGSVISTSLKSESLMSLSLAASVSHVVLFGVTLMESQCSRIQLPKHGRWRVTFILSKALTRRPCSPEMHKTNGMSVYGAMLDTRRPVREASPLKLIYI